MYSKILPSFLFIALFVFFTPSFFLNAQMQDLESPDLYNAFFTHTLHRGMSGNEILILQRALNLHPRTQLAQVGPGSPGNETEYFGSLTESAIKHFQEFYEIVFSGR